MLWPRSMHTQLPASTEMLCGNFEVKHSERDKENSLAALPRRLTPTLKQSLFTRPPKSMNRLRNYHSSVRRAVSWTRIDNTAPTYYLILLPPLTLHLHLPPFFCFSLCSHLLHAHSRHEMKISKRLEASREKQLSLYKCCDFPNVFNTNWI